MIKHNLFTLAKTTEFLLQINIHLTETRIIKVHFSRSVLSKLRMNY